MAVAESRFGDVREPVRVMVVEDDAIVTADVKHSLEAMGYRVVNTLRRGESAVEAVRERAPDLVLMDIRLAGDLDGVEAAEVLGRELDVPVVYMTAYADEETLSRARATSPFGYVVKPFDDQDLRSSIEVALLRYSMVQRVRDERARIAESEIRFRRLFEESLDPIIIATRDGSVSMANDAFVGRFGYEREEIPSLDADVLYADAEDRRRFLETLAVEGGVRDFEVRLITKGGEVRVCRISAVPIQGTDDGEDRIQAIIRDVTERKELEEELRHQALHDSLTGLPNRLLFGDRLEHAVLRAERTGECLAVLFLDLKRFKVVNDHLGHDAGDQLLVEVGRRLTGAVRGPDTVARFGGDEYTVLLEDVADREEAVMVAERIAATFDEPIPLTAETVTVDASFGVVIHDGGQDEPVDGSTLIHRADQAMLRVKRRPGTVFAVGNEGDETVVAGRFERENRLRKAVAEESLDTVYQPVLDTETGALIGAEALARWRSPELGEIPPGTFIPLAEETGVIVALGETQMARACREMLDDSLADPRTGEPPRLFLNLSARELADPKMVSRTRRILQETGYPAERLCLEITETAAVREVDAVTRLRELGVNLAVDDFGTGYATLGQLRQLRVDALKIDRVFVSGLPEDRRDRAIVETVLTLARSLGLFVIGEGVETRDQRDALQELGCNLMQGFYFARPGPADALRDLLPEAKTD